MYFVSKNWRGGVEPLLKNGTLDGYAYKPYYFRAGLQCALPLALWGFSQHLLPNIGEDPKKVLPS